MTEDRGSTPQAGEESASDPDSRLGALRSEDPRQPEADQSSSETSRTHVEDRDVESVPSPKDNTGVSPS